MVDWNPGIILTKEPAGFGKRRASWIANVTDECDGRFNWSSEIVWPSAVLKLNSFVEILLALLMTSASVDAFNVCPRRARFLLDF